MPKRSKSSESDEYPKVINGMTFNSEEELNQRIEADALAFAEFLYDLYQEDKAKKSLES